MTATLSLTAPAGAPTLQSARRLPRSIGDSPNALLYVSISTTATVSFTTTPSFTFTFPGSATPPPGTYYVAIDDPTNASGWQLFEGPATTFLGLGSNTADTVLLSPNATSFTFAGNQTYLFVLFWTAVPLPTPTASPSPTPSLTPTPTAAPTSSPTAGPTPTPPPPSPSPSPPTPSPSPSTPAPTPTPTATPAIALLASTPCTNASNCLQFQVTPPTAMFEVFTASEPGYAGTFTATNWSCTLGNGNTTAHVATLENTTASAGSPGGAATFTVAATDVGSCTVTISDSKSPANSALMTIQVASVSFGFQ